ncbi:MAG: SpoIID/LytB domain-containing protein [Candidatus Krumholzibacteriota bacterium]|nr:SpoIID/LytB domain-containing protein [Candidatus Krumholzibacteriota bacterium]
MEAPAPGNVPTVRVLILESNRDIELDLPLADITARGAEGRVTGTFGIKGKISVGKAGRGIRISRRGKKICEASVLEIKPVKAEPLAVENVSYRGYLRLNPDRGMIQVVNVIEIDDYIKGVLPAEIGYLRPEQYQAYRAQAIASRSYALSKLKEKKGEPFDLRSTIMDQVYKGVKGENPAASRAVDDTGGMVGEWGGEPITAYYSSCCGGYTADIRVGWPWKAHYPYLFGGRDAATPKGNSFCRDSRHFRWKAHWSGDELRDILRKTLPAEIGERVALFRKLIDIKVEGYSRSGRVKALKIVTDGGSYRIEGDRVRWVLRPRSATGPILRSTLFKITVKRAGGRIQSVDLVGGGNGHGVGMCQAGTIKMAQMGYSAEEILFHYYPGITLKRIY